MPAARSTECEPIGQVDECVARNLPRRVLRWHYRSRHESLITFSNRHFYEGRLRTFPSPSDGGGRLGLKHRLVADGRYERGGSGKNLPEANAVADTFVQLGCREVSRDGDGQWCGLVIDV